MVYLKLEVQVSISGNENGPDLTEKKGKDEMQVDSGTKRKRYGFPAVKLGWLLIVTFIKWMFMG
ncbi:hypothetical protein C7436_1911 [Marinobacter nauticus]|nr:hypothetical protein C7436_1911 [Marinobacter nauticus]